MTAPDHAASLADAPASLVRSMPSLPGTSISRLIGLGVPLLGLAFLLTIADVAGFIVFWENAHWTISAALAAALAAIRARQSHGFDRPVLTAIAVGLGSYLLGQIAWDVQAVHGFYAVPAPSDVFFLFTGVPVALAFIVVARRFVARDQTPALYLDAITVFLAVTALVVALIGGAALSQPPVTALTVLAYPAAFLGTSGAGLVAVLASRLRPQPRGAYLFLAGLATTGFSWVIWNISSVTAIPAPGSAINYAFSLGILLAGLGAGTWRSEMGSDERWEPAEALVAALPIVAVLLSLALGVLWRELESPIGRVTAALSAATILVATLRQTLALRERRTFARREQEATERERASRAEAEEALEAQRVSEARYRSVVDVFTRLGEQMTLALDEPALLKAAASALHRLTPSIRGDVLIVNASQNRLVVAASWGEPALEVGGLVPVDRPIRCLGVRRGSIYTVDDVEDALQLACPAHPAPRGSIVCVPMVALGEAVGVIHLERAEKNGFERDELRQAARVAEQVALAVANGRLLKSMERLALTDPLTGLHNARFFDPLLDRELASVGRDGRSVGVIVIDIDRFKHFNDTHGHPAGDDALRAFAHAALGALRGSDTIARYGGEEFVVAVRDADLEATTAAAERIRRAVEEKVIDLGLGRTARITASFGVASTSQHGAERIALLRTADAALYQAKQQGRNQVVAAT